MNYRDLRDAAGRNAAIRRVRRLQPAGGPGDKIFPPTRPEEGGTVSLSPMREHRDTGFFRKAVPGGAGGCAPNCAGRGTRA